MMVPPTRSTLMHHVESGVVVFSFEKVSRPGGYDLSQGPGPEPLYLGYDDIPHHLTQILHAGRDVALSRQRIRAIRDDPDVLELIQHEADLLSCDDISGDLVHQIQVTMLPHGCSSCCVFRRKYVPWEKGAWGGACLLAELWPLGHDLLRMRQNCDFVKIGVLLIDNTDGTNGFPPLR